MSKGLKVEGNKGMTEYKGLAMVLPEIRRTVEKMGFTYMIGIQEKATSLMLTGRELIARLSTGNW